MKETKPKFITGKVTPVKDMSKSVKAYINYKGFDDAPFP